MCSVRAALERIDASTSPLGLDLEANSLSHRANGGYIRTIGFADEKGCWWVNIEGREQEIKDILRAVVQSGRTVILHNAVFELRWFLDMIGQTPKKIHDTMLMGHLLDENGSVALDSLAFRYLKATPWEASIAAYDYDYAKVPISELGPYNALDAYYTLRLAHKLWKLLPPHLKRLYKQVSLRAAIMGATVEHNGIYIDKQWAAGLKAKLEKEVQKHKAAVMEDPVVQEHMPMLNLNSSKQLAHMLYDLLGLTPLERTKKGAPSVRDKALVRIKNPPPLLKSYLAFKKTQTLLTRFVEAIPSKTTKDSIVHPKVNTTGTVTGRFSMDDPPVQQIPRDARVRGMIASRYAGGKLIIADYSQLEVRIVAALAQDETLLAAYREGRDAHEATAKAIFGPTITKEQRTIGKTINFACVEENTKVLTADLRWVPVKDLAIGTRLLTCEENSHLEKIGRGRARRWVLGKITHHESAIEECVQITLSNGHKLICTLEHPFLTNNHSHLKGRWVPAINLKEGWSIPRYSSVWESETGFDAGWLSGMMDGEGWVNTTSIGVAQNPGPIFDKLVRQLSAFDISTTERTHFTKYRGGNSPCNSAVIAGGFHTVVETLGRLYPSRLITNFLKKVVGKTTISAIEFPQIVSIRRVGKKPIVRLSTSTGTYLTEGYFSHNSIYGAGVNKLMSDFNMTMEQAQEILDRKDKNSPAIGRWVRKIQKEVMKNGEVVSIMGRHRRFPQLLLGYLEPKQIAHQQRQAVNFLVQSVGADITNAAAYDILRALGKFKAKIVHQVHDSIIIDAPKEEAEVVAGLVKQIMESIPRVVCPSLGVDLKVEVTICDRWGNT
jgi:DNA polymerase I-like protein with 3'-5' exonuclease and polymerase domains